MRGFALILIPNPIGQKWTGAAYTSNVVVPRTNFKVTKGSPKDYDATGASGKINKHWVSSGVLHTVSYMLRYG